MKERNIRKEAFLLLKRPVTEEEIAFLKVSEEEYEHEYRILERYFDARDNYKKQLREHIQIYGFVGLSQEVLKTIPKDTKVLYEPSWRKQPYVVKKVKKMSRMNAERSRLAALCRKEGVPFNFRRLKNG